MMDEKKTCACGGAMHSMGAHRMPLDLCVTRMLIELRQVDSTDLHLVIYRCETCGKIEFYSDKDPFHAEKLSPVEQYEQTFAEYSTARLQKILDDPDYLLAAKTAAQNLLARREPS